MIFLLLSILFSSITVSFFKLFEIKNVVTFQAIIANYLTCSIIGTFFAKHPLYSAELWQADWLIWAFLLGSLFISIFYAIALTAQKISVSTSMVAAKLSVVIPVLVAYFFYNENLGFLKIIGIFLSLFAVYFISRKESGEASAPLSLLVLPIIVFAGSGSIDTLLKFMEHSFIPAYSADDLVTTSFFFAFVLGVLILLVSYFRGGIKLSSLSLLWGVLLGIPNYFSMYFLVETLGAFDATYIFPLNNIGIVALSTLLAYWFFKEKLNKQNMLGLVLAFLAIILISFS